MAQTYGYEMELKEFKQHSETKFSFSVYLRKTSTSNLMGVENFQFQINFNSDILNGGAITNSFLTVDAGETDFAGQVGNITSSLFTTDGTNIQFASNSAGNAGSTVTVLDNTWKKVADFYVELSKAGNPHNFGDADPELQFRPDPSILYTVLNRCNFTGTGPYTKDGTFSEQVNNRTLIPDYNTPLDTRQLAGYWFSGDGNWSETGRWNNVTTENANTLPGDNSSAIINGNCTISGSKASYSLLPDGNGNGGELTVLTGEEPLFEFDVEINGDGNQTVTIYTQDPFQEITLPANLPAGTKLWLNTDDNTPPPPPFPTFLGWHYPGQSYFSTQAEWVDYTMPSQNTLVIADWSTGSKTIIKQKESRNTLYSSLTIAPGASLTVDKLYNDNENGSEAVIIQSTASGTGSLIHNNTGVQATVERYINRWSEKGEEHGWHFLSSPVASQAIRPEFVPDGNPIPDYIDFYKWDESHFEQGEYGWWINVKDASNNWNTSFEDNFEVGRGYLMAYGTPPKEYGDKAHLFQGEVNVENVTLTGLTHTSGSSHPGWHLVGNPYASAIDWSSGSWTKTNIGDKPQIWDESTASYVVLSALTSTIIPAHNGFMVYTPGAGELTIPADARTHSSTAWYKSGEEDYILLVADDPQGETSQQTIITFNPEATEGFDLAYDAKFLSGYAPMFYSVSQEEAFALNTLPSQNGEITIPLGFVKNSSEEFTISLAGGIQEESIILADMKTNKEQNLVENPVYTFTSEEGDDPNRFLLKLGTVMINETQVNQMDAWVYNKLLHFNSTSNKTTVEVIDITGRPLYTRTVHGTGHQTMPLQMQPGAYIIRLQNEDAIRSLKTIL